MDVSRFVCLRRHRTWTDIRSAECVSDAHARQKALPHIQRLVRLPCRLAATGDGKLMIEYETFVLYSKE